MSEPHPMPCLRADDTCPHWFRCHSAEGCIEAQRDGARSYSLALDECRKRGAIPESWKRDEDHG